MLIASIVTKILANRELDRLPFLRKLVGASRKNEGGE